MPYRATAAGTSYPFADLRTVLAKAIAHDGPTLVDIHSQSLSEAAAPVSEWVA